MFVCIFTYHYAILYPNRYVEIKEIFTKLIKHTPLIIQSNTYNKFETFTNMGANIFL